MNTARLRAVCAAGGLAGAASLRFETPSQGRIHDVHVARDGTSAFVLQRVNTDVIATPEALARVTALALRTRTGQPATPLWPATTVIVPASAPSRIEPDSAASVWARRFTSICAPSNFSS